MSSGYGARLGQEHRMSAGEAMAALREEQTRDGVIGVAVDFLRGAFDFVAVFVRHEETFQVFEATGIEYGGGADLTQTIVDIERSCVLRTVVEGKAPSGPFPRGTRSKGARHEVPALRHTVRSAAFDSVVGPAACRLDAGRLEKKMPSWREAAIECPRRKSTATPITSSRVLLRPRVPVPGERRWPELMNRVASKNGSAWRVPGSSGFRTTALRRRGARC